MTCDAINTRLVPAWNAAIKQGATWTHTLRFRDESGAPIDITGCAIRWAMRPTFDSNTLTASMSTTDGRIVLDEPTNGVWTFTLPAAVTAALTAGRYVHDCEIEWPGGRVDALWEGAITVGREGTRGVIP
jgi:hypothetical protein